MELQAELIDVVRDIRSGGFRLALSMQRVPSEIDSLWGKPLRVSMKQWREKRSLTANGYYWVMVTKISEKLSEEGKEPISTSSCGATDRSNWSTVSRSRCLSWTRMKPIRKR